VNKGKVVILSLFCRESSDYRGKTKSKACLHLLGCRNCLPPTEQELAALNCSDDLFVRLIMILRPNLFVII
jgi:hypothetical protein